jgi:hypothetical protein
VACAPAAVAAVAAVVEEDILLVPTAGRAGTLRGEEVLYRGIRGVEGIDVEVDGHFVVDVAGADLEDISIGYHTNIADIDSKLVASEEITSQAVGDIDG